MVTANRPKRADAVRNLGKILQAAQDQITERGPEASMQHIAKAAGVAVGTLYRHFPTKTDLVGAVLAGYVGDIAEDAEAVLQRARDGASPMAEITGFLQRVTESTAKNHAVKAAAAGLGVSGHGDDEAEGRAAAALAELIELARNGGQIDPSVTVADIYLLMGTAPSDQPAAVRERWLSIMTNGIAARGH